MSADFFPDSKFEKSILNDSIGGRTGGSPLSFLQLVNEQDKMIPKDKKTTIFFIC